MASVAPDRVLSQAAACAALAHVPRCALFTFGYGADHNSELLRGPSSPPHQPGAVMAEREAHHYRAEAAAH